MSREALEQKRNARSEAARERWQLLKLVSRIGVQLKQRNVVDGTWQTDEEAHVVRRLQKYIYLNHISGINFHL
jgi:hypothetical protein